MSIAQLKKVQIVASRKSVQSLVNSFEEMEILHIDDIHEKISKEFIDLEKNSPLDTEQVDTDIAAARSVLDVFQRFNPRKKSMLEDFFGSPAAIKKKVYSELIDTLNVNEYRNQLEEHMSEYDAIVAEVEVLKERIRTVSPWERLTIELADVAKGAHVVLTAISFPVAMKDHFHEMLVLNSDFEFTSINQIDSQQYGVVVSLPNKVDDLQVILKQIRGEEIILPTLHTSSREALIAAHSRVNELERLRLEKAELLITEAVRYRNNIEAIYDQAESRKKLIETRKRVFFSKHVAVLVGWVEKEKEQELIKFLDDKFPAANYQLETPERDDNPPVKLNNSSLVKPFQTLISMYGLPNYFGIDPTGFVAIAMTVFYALALGDFGYGVLQIILASWLRKRFQSTGGTRLFLTMFVYTGVATLIVGLLTWSFFGFSPFTNGGETKFLNILPLIRPTKDIIPLIVFSIGVGVIGQLTSVFVGFINKFISGDRRGAIFDNLSWFILLLGIILTVVGVAVSELSFFRFLGIITGSIAAIVIILFGGRENKNLFGRLLAGLVSLYGIVGYYGIVGFFSDVLSYMRLAILNMTSGFIAYVAEVLGNLFWANLTWIGLGPIVMSVVAIVMGVAVFVFLHLLNLVLSMLGAFVHSLRLNYLESFQRYYPEGGRAFMPLKREGRYFRFDT